MLAPSLTLTNSRDISENQSSTLKSTPERKKKALKIRKATAAASTTSQPAKNNSIILAPTPMLHPPRRTQNPELIPRGHAEAARAAPKISKATLALTPAPVAAHRGH